MFLFLPDNLAQRIGRVGIHRFKRRNLFMEMSKDNALDGDSRCRDCLATK